jgi:hypothetical protein
LRFFRKYLREHRLDLRRALVVGQAWLAPYRLRLPPVGLEAGLPGLFVQLQRFIAACRLFAEMGR